MKKEREEQMCDTTTTETPPPRKRKRNQFMQELDSVKDEEGTSLTMEEPLNPQLQYADMMRPSKRRALDREFATKLSSITLTRRDLIKLNEFFGGHSAGHEQLVQLSVIVSGCLIHLDRHVLRQQRDVIVQISDLVGPVDTHQFTFPQRRLFVYQLGYFQFDQISCDKPDLIDYGPWLADMETQNLLIPSDEFIVEKARSLNTLLSLEHRPVYVDASYAQHNDVVDNDEISVLGYETTCSDALKTKSTEEGDYVGEAGKADEFENDLEDSLQCLSEYCDENDDQNSSIDELVHTKEQLARAMLPFKIVQQLAQHTELRGCLSGCFLMCKERTSNMILIDELVCITDDGKLKFKHRQEPCLISSLDSEHRLTDEIYRQWIDNMAIWREPLPSKAVLRDKRIQVFDACKKAKEQKQRDKMKERRQKRKKKKLAQKSSEQQQQMELVSRSPRISFKNAFGEDIYKILVTPKHLVQLHQLGNEEFRKIASGLLVRYLSGKKTNRRLSIEQIRNVTWTTKPYVMYGQQLTAMLHFENVELRPVPIHSIQFGKSDIDDKLLEQQKLIDLSAMPSAEHIEKKERELCDALRRTKVLKCPPFTKILAKK